MGRNLSSCDDADEYIEIEVSSSTYFCYSISSPHSEEFEFQMCSISLEKEPTTSPADELFYKGNLLPLHLPPRLQMVQNLLQNSSNTTHDKETEPFEENYTTIATTPFKSCNISPSGSCGVRREELNPDDHFLDCSTQVRSFIDDNPKKSWSKKLKLIKQSSLGMKLKASRAYFKSLFTNSGSSDQVCAKAVRNGDQGSESNAKEFLNKYMKVAKKNPFGQIERERYQIPGTVTRGPDKEKIENCGSSSNHRKSFSGAMKKHSETKSSSISSSSSSLSSCNSNGFYEIHMLKRSSSVNSEIECSIQGAIAHCKQSQKLFCPRKTVTEVGFCSLSSSRIVACENQERPGLCRG